ncbi:hypothetical protein AWH62_06400 [Maricaulis sp. W15]|nr:hypothetical protein AWH62_06400 [Maricaulis sp. W15]
MRDNWLRQKTDFLFAALAWLANVEENFEVILTRAAGKTRIIHVIHAPTNLNNPFNIIREMKGTD